MNSDIRKIVGTYGHLVVDIDALADDADLYRAGLASHASVNLMLALEDTFGIEFPQSMLSKSTFSSINAIEAAISELTAA